MSNMATPNKRVVPVQMFIKLMQEGCLLSLFIIEDNNLMATNHYKIDFKIYLCSCG